MITETWPYLFDLSHGELEARAADFRATGTMRQRVAALGDAGFLTRRDGRSLAIVRGQLAYHDPLTDLAFIVQELGAWPIELAGTAPLALDEARSGRAVTVFGLTEPGAGSDVRAIETTAHRVGDEWRITGTKQWISNAPEADRAVIFATAEGSVQAFLVDNPVTEAQAVAGHQIGRILLENTPGTLLSPKGYALAFGTLERCRPTVGLAAWGMAKRAFDETLRHVQTRAQFGRPLANLDLVRLRVAEMAILLDGLALPALHACWKRDTAAAGVRTGYEAAVGKVTATEAAQKVIDLAVQLHGALGVEESSIVQELYRGIRPLRIYEGATDVLHTVIAERWLGPVHGR